jgi:hypothetical protein
LTVVGLGQLAASVALLLIASTSRDKLPGWGGAVDGLLAFTLVTTAALIQRLGAKAVGRTALQRAHEIASVVPAMIFVALWLFRDRLTWNILLPGLAWRTFFVLYVLPASLATWRLPPAEPAVAAAELKH